MSELLLGKKAANRVADDRRGEVWLEAGDTLTREKLDAVPLRRRKDIQVTDGATQERVDRIFASLDEQSNVIKTVFDEKIARLKKGDELPPGVFKMVKVYVAIKRKLSVGDKMAGRHGNKGVISRILPEEDMPYLADGSPVELVLNPLGVPSRMNIGQILEVHLGWAARGLGEQLNALIEQHCGHGRAAQEAEGRLRSDDRVARVLDGASDDAIRSIARERARAASTSPRRCSTARRRRRSATSSTRAGLPTSGQTILFDGRSGDPFDGDVTVGILYMLKLHHLADDKIHARSIGPYSLVTQQPLGGKAQFGGQRLGEMEVWAMEAYGAAYQPPGVPHGQVGRRAGPHPHVRVDREGRLRARARTAGGLQRDREGAPGARAQRRAASKTRASREERTTCATSTTCSRSPRTRSRSTRSASRSRRRRRSGSGRTAK